MKIIKFIKDGETIQLGFKGKELYLKWGELIKPYKLGTLKEIREMGKFNSITLNDKTQQIPEIVRQMTYGITDEGLELADSYTEEQFYKDFLQDYKAMSREGQLIFIGEQKEWG